MATIGYWQTDGSIDLATPVSGPVFNLTIQETMLPVGSIFGVLSSISGCPTPQTCWQNMNGAAITDSSSPYSGSNITDLNSGSNRLLAGDVTSGATGGATQHSHASGQSDDTTDYIDTRTPHYVDAAGRYHDHTLNAASNNNYPPYYDVVWHQLIAVRGKINTAGISDFTTGDSLPVADLNDTLKMCPPIGGVCWFADHIPGCPTLPTDWNYLTGGTMSGGPMNGQALPNCIGNEHFFRGNTTSGNTGGATQHTHSHTNASYYVSTCNNDLDVACASVTHTHGIGYATTLPPHITMSAICRIKGSGEWNTDGTLGYVDGSDKLIESTFASVMKSQIPIGAVWAWEGSKSGSPSLPTSGAITTCGGQVLSDPDSPMDGQTMPAINNNNFFIRAGTGGGNTGGAASHTHSIAINSGTQNVDGGTVLDHASDDTHAHSCGAPSATSLPPYNRKIFLIRVK